MATKTKWFFFLADFRSFLAGILAVCFVVSAVNWLGSETFCSTGCHTMNGAVCMETRLSCQNTQAARPRTALTATLYNASENTLGPLGYISLFRT